MLEVFAILLVQAVFGYLLGLAAIALTDAVFAIPDKVRSWKRKRAGWLDIDIDSLLNVVATQGWVAI